jgi:hypothetical protein
MVSFLPALPQISYMHSSCPPFVLHALPTSSSLTFVRSSDSSGVACTEQATGWTTKGSLFDSEQVRFRSNRYRGFFPSGYSDRNVKHTEHHLVPRSILHGAIRPEPFTVAARSSPTRTLGSWIRIPLKAWMFAFILFVLYCVGSGLASGWSPVQGVLATV